MDDGRNHHRYAVIQAGNQVWREEHNRRDEEEHRRHTDGQTFVCLSDKLPDAYSNTQKEGDHQGTAHRHADGTRGELQVKTIDEAGEKERKG